MNESSPAAEIARSPEAWERLAKSWLVEVIERSPLDEVDDLPLGWIAREASLLIAEVLGQLSDPGAARDLALSPAALERISALAADRDPEVLVTRLPRELSALQSLLIEALDRELPERDRREFTRAVSRLAEVFGVMQAAALNALAGRSEAGPRGGGVPRGGGHGGVRHPNAQQSAEVPVEVPDPSEVPDPGVPDPGVPDPDAAPTPGPAAAPPAQDPVQHLDALARESRRTGTPFTVAHFEVEGVDRISKGYGEEAATRMVSAVAGVLDSQLSRGDRAFKLGLGRFLVAIGGDDQRGLDLAVSVSNVIESSQARRGPRVDVSVGVASFPRHGTDSKELLGIAEEASWAARASGETVALARSEVLQDP
ncbi:MAG TPA: diguanylate cyclase [Solirubrobacterales bacterium]|nr:diguanylate cyclase [Solirubrobacterales bacterium]